MSLSRHEINKLHDQLTMLTQKATTPRPAFTGLDEFAAILKEEQGPPSLSLRKFGQLVKHYLSEFESKSGRQSPNAVWGRFNIAIHLMKHCGYVDVQLCVKKARALSLLPATDPNVPLTVRNFVLGHGPLPDREANPANAVVKTLHFRDMEYSFNEYALEDVSK